MDRRNLFWVDFIDGSMEPKFAFLLHARKAIQMDLFDGSNFFLSFDNFVKVFMELIHGEIGDLFSH